MMGPTHALFGSTIYLALPAVGMPAPVIALPIAVVASLLPDVDMAHSTAGKFLGPVGALVRSFSGGHRKLTHEWWFAAIVVFGCLLLDMKTNMPIGIALPVAVGYGSHLVGDLIPKTGGWLEKLIAAGLWVLLGLIVIYVHLGGWQLL